MMLYQKYEMWVIVIGRDKLLCEVRDRIKSRVSGKDS